MLTDIGLIDHFERRLTFSPYNVHPIFINNLGDNVFMFTNNNEIDFEFTVSRENKVMALVEFKRCAIYFNKQWRLKANVLANRFMDAPSDIVPSNILNFEIGTFGSGRFDVKFDKKEFVALLCTHRNLYSVRFNGDYAIKRFRDYIDREDERRPLDIVRVKKFLEINRDAKSVRC